MQCIGPQKKNRRKDGRTDGRTDLVAEELPEVAVDAALDALAHDALLLPRGGGGEGLAEVDLLDGLHDRLVRDPQAHSAHVVHEPRVRQRRQRRVRLGRAQRSPAVAVAAVAAAAAAAAVPRRGPEANSPDANAPELLALALLLFLGLLRRRVVQELPLVPARREGRLVQQAVVGAGDVQESQALAGDLPVVVRPLHVVRQRLHPRRDVLDALPELLEVPVHVAHGAQGVVDREEHLPLVLERLGVSVSQQINASKESSSSCRVRNGVRKISQQQSLHKKRRRERTPPRDSHVGLERGLVAGDRRLDLRLAGRHHTGVEVDLGREA